MSLPNINPSFERVSAAVVAKAAKFQPAILADVAGRRGALHGRIKALRPSMKLAGPAFTVEVRPGDNLMIHAALALAQPGDVLVIDGKGDQTSALMGTIMMNAARQRGLAGVVIDGAVRDSIELEAMQFPVFSVGTNPNGPTKEVGGRIGHPVCVGGVTVYPGTTSAATPMASWWSNGTRSSLCSPPLNTRKRLKPSGSRRSRKATRRRHGCWPRW